MILGITGTQHGPNIYQRAALSSLIRHPSTTGIHHGDCVGVDEEAHWIAYTANRDIDIHPPIDDKKRAHCWHSVEGWDGVYTGKLTIHPLKEYRPRNYDIVNACERLIAVPHMNIEELRSGTWMTIRYARKVGRPRTIIWPNGKITAET